MIPRRLLLALGIAVALPGVARADGTYAGWINSPGMDDTMVVTTDAAGTTARSFVMAFRAKCADGRSFAFHRTVGVGDAAGAADAVLVPSVNAGGRFTGAYRGASSADSLTFAEHGSVTGTFRRSGARGTIQITIDAADQLTGEAVTTCRSGKLRWELFRGRGHVYGGTTSQGEPVALFLTPDRRALSEFGFGWHTGCSSGDFVDVPDEITNFIIRNGRFGDSFPFVDGAGNSAYYRFSGKLGRTAASGTVRVSMATAWGATCETGRLKWSAVSG